MQASKLMFYLWASTAFVARIKGENDCSIENQCVDGNVAQTSSSLPYAADVLAKQYSYASRLGGDLQDAAPQQQTQQLSKTSNHLPIIHYNRYELDEIIDKIPLGEDKKSILNHKLGFIESRIDSIHQCLRSKTPASFYQDIRMSLTEIGDIAKQIYELCKPYRITLANEVQKKILVWIKPLDKHLIKVSDIPESERRELELKTKRLYAEQSLACRQAELQFMLMEHLDQIKKMLLDTQSLEPHCYLSYAWPSSENKAQEYWVQPFLSILYDHLRTAGIEMVMDIRNNKPGHDIYKFMRKYKDGNHIILVGTESLLQKHESDRAHAVKTELSIINERFEQDQEQYGESRIYPLLISGTHKSSFPEIYDKYRTVREARDGGYVLLLKNLIEWLYSLKIDREANLKLKYQTLWNEFLTAYPGLPRDCTEAQVMQELAEGYHRKRLDELNQDLVYQSIKAQQEAKHSEAVTTKIIAAYMESIGPVPKALFEENGQQFQRPYTNTNFVERKGLWDKMLAHFASQEKLVLMATHGLGGMGKTELAGYYYLHPPRPYNLRAWFYAASRSQLYQQYIELAEANGKFFPKEMSIDEQALRVKKWLEEQKDCLLVYDNVEDASELDGLLPAQGKHHILITSRNAEDFPAKQCLNVDVMEEIEAIELIIKITGIKKDSNLEPLKELVYELGYLPLALAQAAGFMGKTISIGEYLTLYRQRQAELLSNKDEKNPLLPKHEPIWVTFDINFKTLTLDYPPAIATLKQASWVSSAAIPEILFFGLVEEYKGEKDIPLLWANVKKHVYRYSLMRVDTEKHLMSIHPVLQDILRNKQEKAEQVVIFNKISDEMDTLFKYLEDKNFNYRILLAHAERLHEYRGGIAEIAVAQGDKNSQLMLTKPNCLDMLYLDLGITHKALDFLVQKKGIYEAHYGKDHFKTADILTHLGIVYAQLGKLVEAQKHYELALRIQEVHFGNEHVETAGTLTNLGAVYAQLGKLAEAQKHHAQALKIQAAHFGNGHVETAKTLVNLGNGYSQLGKLMEAQEHYKLALGIKERSFGKGHFQTATVLQNLGSVYLQLGKFVEAQDSYEQALKIKEAHFGKGHFETATILSNLGNVYLDLGKLTEAQEHHAQALKIQEAHFGNKHVETVATLNNLGNVYLRLGKLAEAQEHYAQALEIRDKHFGNRYFETASTLANLGTVYAQLGNLVKAQKCYAQALEIQEAHFGKGHFEIANTLANLGSVYLQLGKLVDAQDSYEQALKIKEGHFGKGHFETATILSNLGSVYFQSGELADAQEHYAQALEIQEWHFGNGYFETATILSDLGDVYLDLGKLTEAQGHYVQALKIKEKHFGKGHFETANTLANLGTVYAQLGRRLAKAKEHHVQALKIKEAHFGKGHFETASTLANLGTVYAQFGKLAEAQEHYTQALKIQEAYSGKGHFVTAKTLMNLGNVYADLGQLVVAQEHYAQVLTIQEAHYGKGYVEVANTLFKLGTLFLQLKQQFKAQQYLLRAKEICEREPAGQQYLPAIEDVLQQITIEPEEAISAFDAINTLNQKGIQHYEAKEYAKALHQFQTSFDMSSELFGANDEKTLEAKNRLEECEKMLRKEENDASTTKPRPNFT